MQVENSKLKIQNVPTPLVLMTLLCLFLLSNMGFSQTEPKISTEVDTLSIKIGEQIHYTIIVETDSTNVVHFPEGQSFSPLETVEAIMADTIKNENRVTLQRIYALTQFDSGAYTVPPQIV